MSDKQITIFLFIDHSFFFVRGVKDHVPNTMDMDTQPQGQQAAVPVFQPQVTLHTLTQTHILTTSIFLILKFANLWYRVGSISLISLHIG